MRAALVVTGAVAAGAGDAGRESGLWPRVVADQAAAGAGAAAASDAGGAGQPCFTQSSQTCCIWATLITP